MDKPEITTKTRQVTLETYHWQCPGCGRKMSADREPGDAADALCPGCHQDWQIKAFDEHFAPVMGARVTAIVKPREAFDELDVQRLELTDASGQVWIVAGGRALQVYRRRNRCHPGRHPGMAC
jgi:hypothetical protein